MAVETESIGWIHLDGAFLHDSDENASEVLVSVSQAGDAVLLVGDALKYSKCRFSLVGRVPAL